jgi:hypothetical protein
MSAHLKSLAACAPALALVGMFMSGCDPKSTGPVLFQPYHDPFDTAAPAGFSEIPAPDVDALRQILDRSTPRGKTSDDATFSPNFRPFGTISLAGKDGQSESCVCYDRRIECDTTREFDIGPKDVSAYHAVMKRIDSLDQVRSGTARLSAPPVSIPDVPIK